MTKQMTVKKALTEVWKTINYINAASVDKIVMFYKITPYVKGTDGYISWFLCSKYCARNQELKIPFIRTPWFGTPAEDHFVKQAKEECYKLKHRMNEAIHFKPPYDYIDDLEGYRASDEVNEIDTVFMTEILPKG